MTLPTAGTPPDAEGEEGTEDLNDFSFSKIKNAAFTYQLARNAAFLLTSKTYTLSGKA